MTDINSEIFIEKNENPTVKKHTVSYGYLNDLEHVSDSPWNYEFEAKDDDELYENIKKIIDTLFMKAEVYENIFNKIVKCRDESVNKLNDDLENMNIQFPSYWQQLMTQYQSEIIDDLINKGYWVWNRFTKYYVVAFSLDFTRFDVYSKDCEKKLITWREKDENDQIKGIIRDSNYNENPVVSLMKMLNS